MTHPGDAEAFLLSLGTMECSICEETFGSDHPPVMLDGCRHVFGQECLARWVTSDNAGSNRCPVCRNQLFGEDAAATQSQRNRQTQASSGAVRTTTRNLDGSALAQGIATMLPRGTGQFQAALRQLPGHAGVILGLFRFSAEDGQPPRPRNRLQRNSNARPQDENGSRDASRSDNGNAGTRSSGQRRDDNFRDNPHRDGRHHVRFALPGRDDERGGSGTRSDRPRSSSRGGPRHQNRTLAREQGLQSGNRILDNPLEYDLFADDSFGWAGELPNARRQRHERSRTYGGHESGPFGSAALNDMYHR
jgi:hypothetical protein